MGLLFLIDLDGQNLQGHQMHQEIQAHQSALLLL